MENSTWTFFCRTGAYDGDYRPALRRYICHGAVSSLRAGDNGEGVGQNRLTLQIRDRHTCLLDDAGRFTTLGEAAIQPGDRIAAGVQEAPGDTKVWRVLTVTPPADGISCGRVWTVTAQ